MSAARPGGRRLSRRAQRQDRERRAHLDPERLRRELVAAESGAIVRDAPFRIALCYPNPYRVAMSSLGYQVIYRMLNSRPGIACERVVLPDQVDDWRRRRLIPVALESGRRLCDFDLIAFSLAFDLDVPGVFDLMQLSGVPILRDERGPRDPMVWLGGPLTASNPLPLAPFIDLAVIGDGEVAVEHLLDALEVASDRDALLARAASIDGVWVPEVHDDAVPATQKVTTSHLPAYGQIVTPHTELSNMFLVEASRGCPRFCKFCIVRQPESPMRETEVDVLLSHVPASAERVGFVGAAVSEYTGIREALRRVIEQGKGVSVSSLRADRLDEEFVELLARGGYRTMTVAADAPSQRQRDKMAKGLRTQHLRAAAELGRHAGMVRLKMYTIVGLPDETDEDLDELIDLARELASIMPLALAISPLVPKLHTPLGDAPFAGIAAIDRTLRRVKRALAGRVDVRSVSARWAWVEYRMSQGDASAGLAALEAWRKGGRFADWRAALAGLPERGGLDAARRHGLFEPAGMR